MDVLWCSRRKYSLGARSDFDFNLMKLGQVPILKFTRWGANLA